MKIWLDDEISAPKGWTWVRTTSQMIDMISSGDVTTIDLDYHLSTSKTGMDVLDWLEQRLENGILPPETILIHTGDTFARARMRAKTSLIRRKARSLRAMLRREG